jgi:hypothetical protein
MFCSSENGRSWPLKFIESGLKTLAHISTSNLTIPLLYTFEFRDLRIEFPPYAKNDKN